LYATRNGLIFIGARAYCACPTVKITKGDQVGSDGNAYNSKIIKFQKRLSEIRDIAKYDYVVFFLGNVTRYNDDQLRRLIDNCEYEIFNFEKTYNELVFPLCTGTYFDPDEIIIRIDLQEKEHPKLKQKIATDFGNYIVTVIFVPTYEIGRILSKYKNAILKYNPRNFLALKENSVNSKIKDSIISHSKNNFAILNNGLTILSDNVNISESTGEENRGQLILTRPQILNGGQTAFTLSTIFDEFSDRSTTPLNGKEVLVKIITPLKDEGVDQNFVQMISNSTNQQSEVKEADRRSNHSIQINLQEFIYKKYGYFYERKVGEFYDGIKDGILTKELVIDRLDLIKAFYAYKGYPSSARRSSEKILFRLDKFLNILDENGKEKEMFFSYLLYKKMIQIEKSFKPKNKSIELYGYSLMYGKWSVITAIGIQESSIPEDLEGMEKLADELVNDKIKSWKEFDIYAKANSANSKYFGEDTNFELYYKVSNVDEDIFKYFKK
jgi:hypothetical protein